MRSVKDPQPMGPDLDEMRMTFDVSRVLYAKR
jgi:hypothetical protein